jgi:DNA-binding transcriptional LysR family regulator
VTRRPKPGRGGSEDARWLGIQGRHLAALATVAEEGTFARAAARLGYTQSTISHQVATLERLVGKRLVDRGPGAGAVELTRAGELFLEHAQGIIARFGAARADLAAVGEGNAGTLRIGIFHGVGTSLVPLVLGALRHSWPGVRVELAEGDGGLAQQERVSRGELELTFALAPLRHPALEARELLADPFVLVLASPADARGLQTPSWTLAAGPPCPSQRRTEEALAQRGIRPRDVVRVDNPAVVEELVAAGAAFGLLPRLALRRPGLAVVELGSSSASRHLLLAWHRDRTLSEPASTFVDLVEAAARRTASGAAADGSKALSLRVA